MSAVPTTPSSSLPAWRRVKLGEICSKPQYGWTTKARQDGAGLKLLRTTDITSGHIDWSTVPFCTEPPPDAEKYLVHEGDILISRAGSVGVSHLVTSAQPAVFASYLIRFKPGPDVLPKYLAYFLQSPSYWKQIADNTAGIAVPNVNASKLQELELPLAPPDEQRSIVAEIERRFSLLDEAVAMLTRASMAMSAYRASVLEAAIRGQLVSASGPTSTSRLDDLIGKIHQGWSPKCDLQREPGPDEWAVITTTAVQPMRYVDNQGKPLPTVLEPRPWLEIQPGDFLVTRKGPRARAGVACLVRRTRRRLMVCDTVYRFRCDESKVVPDYLEIAINAPSVVQAVDRQKAGINESGVSLTHHKLGGIAIPVPSRAAQKRIVAEVDRRLSIVREVETEVDANLKRAQVLRQAVLASTFSGGLWR